MSRNVLMTLCAFALPAMLALRLETVGPSPKITAHELTFASYNLLAPSVVMANFQSRMVDFLNRKKADPSLAEPTQRDAVYYPDEKLPYAMLSAENRWSLVEKELEPLVAKQAVVGLQEVDMIFRHHLEEFCAAHNYDLIFAGMETASPRAIASYPATLEKYMALYEEREDRDEDIEAVKKDLKYFKELEQKKGKEWLEANWFMRGVAILAPKAFVVDADLPLGERMMARLHGMFKEDRKALRAKEGDAEAKTQDAVRSELDRVLTMKYGFRAEKFDPANPRDTYAGSRPAGQKHNVPAVMAKLNIDGEETYVMAMHTEVMIGRENTIAAAMLINRAAMAEAAKIASGKPLYLTADLNAARDAPHFLAFTQTLDDALDSVPTMKGALAKAIREDDFGFLNEAPVFSRDLLEGAKDMLTTHGTTLSNFQQYSDKNNGHFVKTGKRVFLAEGHSIKKGEEVVVEDVDERSGQAYIQHLGSYYWIPLGWLGVRGFASSIDHILAMNEQRFASSTAVASVPDWNADGGFPVLPSMTAASDHVMVQVTLKK